MYNKTGVIFILSNTTPILHPMGQGIISTFKLYYLRIYCVKAITTIDNDPTDGPRQSKNLLEKIPFFRCH